MCLWLAIKAFIKALKEPNKAKSFLNESLERLDSSHEYTHLRLLAMLQQSGRLIDFFKEDIKDFSNEQIGAAVRQIHSDCGKSLEDLVTIRPLLLEKEGSEITIPKGYDPKTIKISGKIKGEPPYKGTLVHQGWKAHKRSLPQKFGDHSNDIICPAEIEVKG